MREGPSARLLSGVGLPGFIGFLGLLAAAGAARAADTALPSGWRRADVTIDGFADDWTGRLVPLEKSPLSVGVENDGRFLFVCVRTSDEATKKQILARGLSVYLDESAKERRGFGIRYPAGLSRSGHLDPPDTGEPRSTRALQRAVAGTELVFLGSEDGESVHVPVSAARPVEAALGEENGVLIVELKVPLAFSVDSPHAVGSQPGKRISVGLETTEPKREPTRSPEGGDGSGSWGHGGGGFGFGGGGGGGHGGGGRHGSGRPPEEGSRSRDLGKPLKEWLLVTLAAEPAP